MVQLLISKVSLPESINRKPLVFIKGQEFPQKVIIRSFTPSEFDIQVEAENPDSLIILQNNYSMWKANINDSNAVIQRSRNSFYVSAT